MRRVVAVALAGAAALGCDAGTRYIGRESLDAGACAPACASAAACGVDYCQTIPQLAAPPRIDGVLECGLALASIDPSHWYSPYPEPSPLAVEYAAGWTPSGLYVFVHVQENQRLPSLAPPGGAVYCGDATHVFVDDDGRFDAPPTYDGNGTRQLAAEAPPDATSPTAVGTVYSTDPSAPGLGAWDAAHFTTFPTSDGYVLEAVVQAADLALSSWTLGPGQSVGFDVSISYGGSPSEYSSDPGCLKRGDFVMRVDPASSSPSGGLPHADVGAFCTPVLTASPP